ncbi:hypothetical protein [Vampirovibrio sp.]|uniref:hypothetical protein n=1 Tax=Vampirovibrio sp. TaxID=2717857 RepID=UPI0035945E7A
MAIAQENNSNIFRFYQLLTSITESTLVALWDKLNLLGNPLTEEAQVAAYLQGNVQEWLFQTESLEATKARKQKILECTEESPEPFAELFSWFTEEQVFTLKKLAEMEDINIQFLEEYKKQQFAIEIQEFRAAISALPHDEFRNLMVKLGWEDKLL